MNRADLERLSQEQLIEIVLAQAELIDRLTKRVAELEARVGLPAKTPENSSVPPSQAAQALGPAQEGAPSQGPARGCPRARPGTDRGA